MKILHINSSDTGIGGASRIALGLHEECKKRDLESIYLSGTGSLAARPSFHGIPKQKCRKLLARLLANDLKYFNSNYIFKQDFYKSADVVHFHNIHGWYFNLTTFQRICHEKKVIWTLHDQWALTPHCAYTNKIETDDGLFACDSLSSYPGLLWDNTQHLAQLKKQIYRNASFTITTPSKWLMDKVERTVLVSKPTHYIPNGIDTNIFYPKNSKRVREQLKLPLDRKIILFVAAKGLDNEFKGGDLLRKVIETDHNDEHLYVIVGKKDSVIEQQYKNVRTFTSINDQTLLADYYSAADISLFPSKHEVFGLVAIESIACGTPSIVANVGGMPETILSPEYGEILPERSVSAIKAAITKLLDRTHKLATQEMYNKVLETHSIDIMCEKYLAIYHTAS